MHGARHCVAVCRDADLRGGDTKGGILIECHVLAQCRNIHVVVCDFRNLAVINAKL
jgi:hypothetical protein